MANIIEITDFELSELDVYARYSEVQLLRIHEPKPGIFIAESPKVIERALDAGYEPISMLVEHRHIETQAKGLITRCGDIPVYTAEYEVLTKLTGFALTRGMLCAMKRRVLPTVAEVCQKAHRIAVLENVVKPYQCGSNFPFGGGTSYGCGATDSGMQQSPVPPGDAREYGNSISGAVDDLSGERKVAGGRYGMSAETGI